MVALGRRIRHVDGRVVVLLVGQRHVFLAAQLVALRQGLGDNASLVVGIGELLVLAVIDGHILHVLRFIVGVAILAGQTLIVWVGQHVEGVAVELELIAGAVGSRQRCPALQGAVVGVASIARAAIHTGRLHDMGIGKAVQDFRLLRFGRAIALEGFGQGLYLGVVHQFAVEDVVLVVQP